MKVDVGTRVDQRVRRINSPHALAALFRHARPGPALRRGGLSLRARAHGYVAPVRFASVVAAAVVVSLSSCTGFIEGPSPNPLNLPPAEPPPASWTIPERPATCVATRAPGVRLLTNAQVDATLEAVFSQPSPLGTALPPEALISGYTANAGREVSSLYVDTVDEQSGAYAALVAPGVAAGLACGPTEAEAACVERTLATLGAALWRHPLAADEVQDLMAVYTAGRSGGAVVDGLTLAVQALVGAPSFLYRRELGTPDGDHLKLTADELAEALAYDFTGAPPDDTLRAKAASGVLDTPAGREAEAQRLLETPRGKAHLAAFATEWMELMNLPQVTRDATRFPAFSNALRDSMVKETTAFTQSVFYGPSPTAKTLWSSTTAYVDDNLAAFYGLEARPGATLAPVDVSATTRRGLLGHAGVLLVHGHVDSTSPVKRGVFVLKRALCQPLPPPPPNVMFSTGSPDEPRTTRERYAQHSSDPSCAGCHRIIDPPGFALEGFDAIGQARTEEHGFALDLTGQLTAGSASGPLDGSVDLSAHIAGSQEAAECLVQQLGSFTLGTVASSDDACVLDQMRHDALSRNGDGLAALRALAGSDAYVTRRAP